MGDDDAAQGPRATFGLVGKGRLHVERHEEGVVTVTMPNGFVLTLVVAEARALAASLSNACR